MIDGRNIHLDAGRASKRTLPICVLGVEGGVSPKGLVHNLVMQFFTEGSSKITIFRNPFF